MTDPTYLIASFMAFISASHMIVQKRLLNLSLNYKSMMIINAFFFAFFGLLMAIYYRDTVIPDIKRIQPKYYAVLGITILFSTFINSALNYELLLRNNAYIVSGLTLAAPIFTVLLAKFYLKEDVSCKGVFGIGIILLGIWLVIQAKQEADLRYHA